MTPSNGANIPTEVEVAKTIKPKKPPKIKDKIELLESESYAKRIAGVKGWQSSPVNKMYVDLTRQALVTGKPIEQVAAAKQKGGSDSLSKEEIQAIMKLNNQLRF